MGWSIGYDEQWDRDIGYGVPSTCDEPGCRERIDRGLSFVCGGEPYGGNSGCGLYFCSKHLFIDGETPQRCHRCIEGVNPYEAKKDRIEWLIHKMTDSSWEAWRNEELEKEGSEVSK